MSASSQMFGRSVGLFGGITGAMSALSCIALLLTVGSAAAQQCDWLPGHGVAGTAGQVNAIVTWDPDGAGPASEVLVVGGQLTAAGDTITGGVAAWDGSAWQALGFAGGDGDTAVNALAVFDGQLIAAGYLPLGGGLQHGVARWDGAAWQLLGSGVEGDAFTAVNALAVHNGQLVAGGSVRSAAGAEYGCVARWNGIAWRPMGSPLAGEFTMFTSATVKALCVYAGELIAGGRFTVSGIAPGHAIARWDGSDWQTVGAGMGDATDLVNALALYNGELIAGGSFMIPGSPGCHNIARWNGSAWQALESGLDNEVAALTAYGSELVAGGYFSAAGAVPCENIARWNGTAWQALGSGIASAVVYSSVHGLGVYNGELIVGGSFLLAGGVACSNVARWDGSAWNSLGAGTDALWLSDLLEYGGDLIAGGALVSGGGSCIGVGRWNEAAGTWQALGSGVNVAKRLILYDGELVAAGSFTAGDGTMYHGVARWAGSAWQALGPWAADAGSPNIEALAVYNGDLIAGGMFTSAAGVPCNNVARWNAAAGAWQPLGAGIDGIVGALTVYRGELIAAGAFATAGGTPCSSIARWNGTAWQPLGAGTDGIVAALAEYDGELIAGGYFTSAGGVACNNIARWDGSTWRPLGAGIGSSGYSYVSALGVHNGVLIVGGLFATADGAQCIARWNGLTWQTLGLGMDNLPYALLSYQGELVAAGAFTAAGGHVSCAWGRYSGEWPAAPNNVSASDGLFCDKVRVTWGEVPGATGYKVYRSATGSVADGLLLGTSQSGAFDDVRAAGRTVWYFVVASNACGDGPCSGIDGGFVQCGELPTWYRDSDGDGYGDPGTTTQAAQQPPGFVANDDDCDDGCATCHPGAQEVCDGRDNDCDGWIDAGAIGPTWYRDADGDGYGNPDVTVRACSRPAGYVENGDDCNDTIPAVNPGVVEICNNGINDDCDGLIDCDDPDCAWDLGCAELIADAGPDLNLSVASAAEGANVMLDGSRCSGNIVEYTWTENGKWLASGRTAVVLLRPGTHDIVLTIRDAHGRTASDTLRVSVNLDDGGDEDLDGVLNAQDDCPGTPAEEAVDANGCSCSQLDTDGDETSDCDDLCPTIPGSCPNGCPPGPSGLCGSTGCGLIGLALAGMWLSRRRNRV